jgi:hypothetical protein
VSGYILVKVNMIDLLFQILRMSELRCHISIVGKQEYTCCITIKASYWIDTLWTCALDKIHDSLTLLRIITGGDIVLRLVKQHIDLLLGSNRSVVEHHGIGAHNLGTQFGNHLTIDRHDSCLDELVSLSTAAYTGVSQELIQTNGLVGIVILLLIFYTLL